MVKGRRRRGGVVSLLEEWLDWSALPGKGRVDLRSSGKLSWPLRRAARARGSMIERLDGVRKDDREGCRTPVLSL